MMLHDRDDDLITFLDVGAAVGIGYEVQAFCRVTRKDNLVLVTGVDEVCDSLTSVFIILGGFQTKLIEAAHRIRIFRFVEAFFCVDDLLGLLGRRAIVKINETSIENREVTEDRLVLAGAFFL